MKPWHALWCQAGARLLGALCKVRLRNFTERWVWLLSSSLERLLGEWVEGEREVGRKVKMHGRRGGGGGSAQRADMPSQLSLVTGLRPSVADLRNTTLGPHIVPPPFRVLFLLPFLSLHSPASLLLFL